MYITLLCIFLAFSLFNKLFYPFSMALNSFKTLDAYKIGYRLSMEIFNISKTFPKDESYSITSQIRRSSRSICSNLAEGYRKRMYLKHFLSKLTDSDAECSETSVWLDYCKDCNYISEIQYKNLIQLCQQTGKILGYMIEHPEKYFDGNFIVD